MQAAGYFNKKFLLLHYCEPYRLKLYSSDIFVNPYLKLIYDRKTGFDCTLMRRKLKFNDYSERRVHFHRALRFYTKNNYVRSCSRYQK